MTQDRARRRTIAALKLLLGLGLVAIVVWLLGPQWEQVLKMAELRPVPIALALLATTFATIVTSLRWKVLGESMGGTRLPYVVYVHAFTLTRVLGQFTSNLAMDTIGRGVALKTAGSERGLGHAMAPIVLERIFDLVLPIVVGSWALAVATMGWQAHADLLLAATALVFALLAVPLLAPLARLALAVYGFVAKRRGPVEDIEITVSRRVAAQVALLSLARFTAVVLQFTAVALAFGIDIEWRAMAAATPLAQISSLMGFTPGSLGFQEAGWALGLDWVGLGIEAITLFVLAQRVAVTSFFGILSLVTWPFARKAKTTA